VHVQNVSSVVAVPAMCILPACLLTVVVVLHKCQVLCSIQSVDVLLKSNSSEADACTAHSTSDNAVQLRDHITRPHIHCSYACKWQCGHTSNACIQLDIVQQVTVIAAALVSLHCFEPHSFASIHRYNA
jgi:hypothetical protein